MKEEALALALGAQDFQLRRNLLREYLQAFVLRVLHQGEAFECLSFVGGTALRFLYDLPRFSEDLDFSLERETGYHPLRWMQQLERELTLAGFDAEVTLDDRRTVHSAWVKVTGILAQAGLAARPEQKLSVKLEIDTRPPAGAVLEKQLVSRHFLLALRHHNLESLMAGKIHALLTRPYAKGRDWYDLIWYRARRPPVEPNLVLLSRALQQSVPEQGIDPARWSEVLLERLALLDTEQLMKDVQPFLQRPAEARLMEREALESVLTRASS